jgi:ribosomal protein L37AE/L43A
MHSYRCPACGETTKAELDRVVWCASCAQPLTITDLMPFSVTIEHEEPGEQPPITA